MVPFKLNSFRQTLMRTSSTEFSGSATWQGYSEIPSLWTAIVDWFYKKGKKKKKSCFSNNNNFLDIICLWFIFVVKNRFSELSVFLKKKPYSTYAGERQHGYAVVISGSKQKSILLIQKIKIFEVGCFLTVTVMGLLEGNTKEELCISKMLLVMPLDPPPPRV